MELAKRGYHVWASRSSSLRSIIGQGFVTQIKVKILIEAQNGCLSAARKKKILN
jgi:hypothetical protein